MAGSVRQRAASNCGQLGLAQAHICPCSFPVRLVPPHHLNALAQAEVQAAYVTVSLSPQCRRRP